VQDQGIATLHLLCCAALVFGIVFCTFLPALQNQFVDWDDTDNFVRNEMYRGLGWENIKWMFTTFHWGHYQPLTWLTLGVDATIARAWFHDSLDPRPYHFTNVLLHSMNAVLVFLLAVKLIGWRRRGMGPAREGPGGCCLPARSLPHLCSGCIRSGSSRGVGDRASRSAQRPFFVL
jgi:hypothetical protein